VLRYAHEHGCPVDFDECLESAEINRYDEVVEFLLAAQLAARALLIQYIHSA